MGQNASDSHRHTYGTDADEIIFRPAPTPPSTPQSVRGFFSFEKNQVGFLTSSFLFRLCLLTLFVVVPAAVHAGSDAVAPRSP